MSARPAFLLLACVAGCAARPAPPDAAAPGPDASAPRTQAAPAPDPALLLATGLHEPCPAAEKGARAADAALDADPRSAAGLFRLGEWLRLREAHCFEQTAPARHASSAADAFARALRLDPTRDEYAIAFAQARPEEPEAIAALDALLARDPRSGAARLLKARRPGTKPEDAIALLSEEPARCVAGLQLELGDLLVGQRRFAAARDAYLGELDRPCEPLGVSWAGEDLSRRAAARLGLATASLELGELETARRQLSWLHYDAVDAALPLVDPEVEERLWKRLEEKERQAPRTPPSRSARLPNEPIAALEEAALRGEWARFKALLVDEKDLDRAFPGCAQYGEDTGARGTYALCVLRELLPEAPRVVRCELKGSRSAECAVVGADLQRPWVVYLARSGAAWKVASSKRPGP